jgi:hypothetical protein
LAEIEVTLNRDGRSARLETSSHSDTIREWEAANCLPTRNTVEPLTIQLSGDRFLTDAKARQLNESTIYK